MPTANNTYDLGSSSARWRDIYTNDLNLSNKGGTNDVDGTWGSYTIQEGEEDLFLINRRNGKKYKFHKRLCIFQASQIALKDGAKHFLRAVSKSLDERVKTCASNGNAEN